ncbi:uncharacterized protein LOC118187747 [Stegodyphus dumicola]|uniref:uncharacterized protein LOC118187747 n=1 Tax=Stegodyphus dumicola TaxID=202533 RepID=UPI0015A9235C|nr:uncharacterized protein LOC118187747 [Stegodyphus dumicola]
MDEIAQFVEEVLTKIEEKEEEQERHSVHSTEVESVNSANEKCLEECQTEFDFLEDEKNITNTVDEFLQDLLSEIQKKDSVRCIHSDEQEGWENSQNYDMLENETTTTKIVERVLDDILTEIQKKEEDRCIHSDEQEDCEIIEDYDMLESPPVEPIPGINEGLNTPNIGGYESNNGSTAYLVYYEWDEPKNMAIPHIQQVPVNMLYQSNYGSDIPSCSNTPQGFSGLCFLQDAHPIRLPTLQLDNPQPGHSTQEDQLVNIQPGPSRQYDDGSQIPSCSYTPQPFTGMCFLQDMHSIPLPTLQLINVPPGFVQPYDQMVNLQPAPPEEDDDDDEVQIIYDSRDERLQLHPPADNNEAMNVEGQRK